MQKFPGVMHVEVSRAYVCESFPELYMHVEVSWGYVCRRFPELSVWKFPRVMHGKFPGVMRAENFPRLSCSQKVFDTNQIFVISIIPQQCFFSTRHGRAVTNRHFRPIILQL